MGEEGLEVRGEFGGADVDLHQTVLCLGRAAVVASKHRERQWVFIVIERLSSPHTKGQRYR